MLIAVIVLAIAGATVWWQTRPLTVRPGKVRFELRDAWGRPWPEPATIWVDPVGAGDESTEFEVREGELKLVVRPPPVVGPDGMRCGTTTPFEHGSMALRVEGSAATTTQTVTLRLGPSVSEGLSSLVKERYDDFEATRTVTVTVELPDGGPAGKVWVTCDDELTVTDEQGKASCGRRKGAVGLRAGVDGVGAAEEVAETDAHATLRVVAPTAQLHVVARTSSAARSQFVIRSKDFSKGFLVSTPELFVPAVPRARFIVCLEAAEAACEVVVPPLEGGLIDVVLEPGPLGELEFIASTVDGVVPTPIVYLDRNQRPEVKGPTIRLPVSPGRHVLVLNVHGGPERYETLVTIDSGKTTSLGTVLLAPP